MHLVGGTLCGSLAWRLKADEDVAAVLAALHVLGLSAVRDRGASRAMTPRVRPVVDAHPHMIAATTFGERCLLFLTTYRGTPQCLLVGRRVSRGHFHPRIFLVRLLFNDASLFAGTVFDGELLPQGLFLIGDMPVERGVRLDGLGLPRRLNRLYENLAHGHVPDPTAPFALQVRRCFRSDARADLDALIAALPYPCRGIVHVPMHLRYRETYEDFKRPGRIGAGGGGGGGDWGDEVSVSVSVSVSDGAFRTEGVEDRLTRMFRVRRTALPDVYELRDPADEESAPPDIAGVPDLATSAALASALADTRSDVLMECEFDARFGRWVPKQ